MTDSSDQMAEATRLNERLLLNAGGGGNPNVAAVNNMKSTVDSVDATNRTYSDILKGNQDSAIQTLSGVGSTYADMDMGAFNLEQSAIDRNAAIDKNKAAWMANAAGGLLKVGGGIAMGNPGLALSGAGSLLAQEGGYIGYNQGGMVEDPENPTPVGNGMSDEATMLSMAMERNGYQTGGKYSSGPGDTVPAMLEEGEYVLNRNAVDAVGKENLDNLNNQVEPRFNDTIKMRMGGYKIG